MLASSWKADSVFKVFWIYFFQKLLSQHAYIPFVVRLCCFLLTHWFFFLQLYISSILREEWPCCSSPVADQVRNHSGNGTNHDPIPFPPLNLNSNRAIHLPEKPINSLFPFLQSIPYYYSYYCNSISYSIHAVSWMLCGMAPRTRRTRRERQYHWG